MFKTAEQGAATSVWCATSSQLEGLGGVYCEDCDIAVRYVEGGKAYGEVRDHAVDQNAARDLWALSEKLTGVSYG
jgi:hypothetical protein